MLLLIWFISINRNNTTLERIVARSPTFNPEKIRLFIYQSPTDLIKIDLFLLGITKELLKRQAEHFQRLIDANHQYIYWPLIRRSRSI
jgi:hypothetical protein